MSDVHNFWFSKSEAHNFFSFSQGEAARLVSSARLPLFDRIPPEKYTLLNPTEAMVEQFIFNAGALFDDDIEPCPCQRLWVVYDILESLLEAFARVDMRTPRAFSRANVEHLTLVTKRLRMLIQALDDPSTKLFNGGRALEDFVRDCKAQLAKFTRWANILDRTPRDYGGDQSLEEFISGPLSGCYKQLFDRPAGGNERGPFARFGHCFFNLLGHQVALGTIARAVKKTRARAARRAA